jgi:hypothetical protein
MDILGFEGRSGEEESKDDDTQGPDIYFEVITLAFQHFWGDVVGGAADCAFVLPRELELSG